jgi:hypothetical protein
LDSVFRIRISTGFSKDGSVSLKVKKKKLTDTGFWLVFLGTGFLQKLTGRLVFWTWID